MKDRFKQLGKDSIIYGLGGVLAKGLGFFLLPVYTRIFTPAEYGTIEMLVVINGLLSSLLAMGMDSAQSFYFFEQKESGKTAQARLVTAILQWRLSWGALIVLGAMVFSPLINHWFFNGLLSWKYFAVAFSGALCAQVMAQSSEVFRLIYRPWRFIGITLLNTLLSAGVAITLVVWLDYGILGYFVGMLVGAFFSASFGWWLARSFLDWSEWHRDWWPKLLRFGVPLLPAGLAMYVMNTSDRWFISYYHDETALGIYAVAAKFAMLISLAVTTFRQAWWPVAMDAMQSHDGPELFRTIGQAYLGLGSAGVLILTALSPLLVQLFTGPAFHNAYPMVGALAWYAIFYGFFLIGSAGIWKREKTIWTTVSMAFAACLNILLDYLWVPIYGAMGAAVATSVSFLVWNVIALLISERLWRVGYPLVTLGFQVLLGSGICAIIISMQLRSASAWQIVTITALGVILLLFSSIDKKYFKMWLRR